MSHSKRNTSLAFFTSYERSLLRNSWGSQSTRLTRDSFLPFASCRLCLLAARDPVACSSGSKADILCRECALNDLMAQRKEIKRLEREWEGREVERGEDERRVREEGARRELEKFERVAQGLRSDNRIINGTGKKKRKASELEDDNSGLQHRIEDSEAKTDTSFWVPGIDTTALKTDPAPNEKPTKLHPICPASTPSTKHSYSLKSLITVNFTEEQGDAAKAPVRICPACKKTLSNTSKAVLTRPCGHVLCGSCVASFMTPPDTPDAHDADADAEEKRGKVLCYVCETDVTEPKHKHKHKLKAARSEEESKDRLSTTAATITTTTATGLMEISCEGTGFAGGGSNLAKREGVAFQC